MSVWVNPEMLGMATGGGRCVFSQLTRDGVSGLIAHLHSWCPHISLGSFRHYADPDFYELDTTLAGEDDKSSVVYVGRYNGELVCMVSMRIDDAARVLVGEFSAASPFHKHDDVAAFWSTIMEAQAKAAGVALAVTYVTASDLSRQRLVEHAGFTPVGIVPCSDRAWTKEGIQHVSDVLYARVFAPANEVARQDDGSMTTAVRRLWMTIFASP